MEETSTYRRYKSHGSCGAVARRLLCVLLVLLPLLRTGAQEAVPPLERWIASVDTATGHIELSWNASPGPRVMGYHICTGDTCREYAVVYGRMDTTYTCTDHSSLERHVYAIHVFDSSAYVSSLTPHFGNMVLRADLPECATMVEARWSPYEGMPGGLRGYRVMVRQEPFDVEYLVIQTVDSGGELRHRFEMNPSATRVSVMVQAVGHGEGLVSTSNVVSVTRRTVDSAARCDIVEATYDSVRNTVGLVFDADTAYRGADYRLWRSVDGSPWEAIATVAPWRATRYSDRDINRFDSLYCYQLSVTDACGLNERFSATRCLVVPDPPEPAAALPNAVVAGDEGPNGVFLPRVRGMMGDLYELYIYDRRGRLIYQTTDPAAGWRPAADTPQGAYAYALRLRYNNNDIATYTGTITVIK